MIPFKAKTVLRAYQLSNIFFCYIHYTVSIVFLIKHPNMRAFLRAKYSDLNCNLNYFSVP